jgi:hypothetical protein
MPKPVEQTGDNKLTSKEWSRYELIRREIARGMFLTIQDQHFLLSLVERLSK